MSARSDILVAPSKDAAGENFPVGSWLLPARLRPHVAAFYAVVRAADDIADHPDLAPADKIARLDAIDAVLAGGEPTSPDCAMAARLRGAMAEAGVTIEHARNLLRAFRQDAEKGRYADWDDLLAYCRHSANPVGRFLLDLHGEGDDGHAASDALCTALQIINHLQDCGDDYRELDRVYLPLDLFAAVGATVEDLGRPEATPALRWVLDRTLDGVDALLAEARPLAPAIRHPGMRREAAVIVALAERLAAELRRRDPLGQRVELGRAGKLACILCGLWRTLPRAERPADPAAAYARHRVQRAGTSFYWAMRLLPAARREAMFAIYAFCREVDDVADGPMLPEAKRRALAAWRDEVAALYDGRPRHVIARALAGPVERFALRRGDFDAILDGVGMDAEGSLRAPALDELALYCSRVAGAVGLLSVRIFGCRDARADDFALAVGEALQLTNILRDVAEDAAEDRLYLPAEALAAAGIATRDPAAVVAHPDLAAACRPVARRARERFAEARRLLAAMSPVDRAAVRPAVIMMAVYDRLLARLVGGGWREPERRISVPGAEKMWIALRHAVLS